MLRVERTAGALTVVSRLPRLRVLAVLAAFLAAGAAAVARPAPGAALALAVAAGLVPVLGARAVRARFERGRVSVRPAAPFAREAGRPLAAFRAVRVETFAEARRRRAEELARGYAARSGAEMPSWLRRPDAPGPNDRLRRVVLVAGEGERFAVTAWLADGDLEPACRAIEAALGS